MQSKKASHRYLSKALGKYIAEKRKERFLTQAQLAEMIGIETVSLSRIETGSALPSLVRLKDLAEALNVTIIELIGASAVSVKVQATEIEQHLEVLSPQDRLLMLDWIKRFSERLGTQPTRR